ncbi:MAG: type I restriction-modification system subunit M N-terminal domain-containing protein [Endozoicomonadaceae bacterium]|nr:type I restriction-modification system subunit M N-terminal domain-containing protein [Endozoicomonadaceae bacterium]
MTNNDEQEFLSRLNKKLWNATDKLRSTLDVAQYKHTVLGLVFIKYVSDSFKIHQEALTKQFIDEDHVCYIDPASFSAELILMNTCLSFLKSESSVIITLRRMSFGYQLRRVGNSFRITIKPLLAEQHLSLMMVRAKNLAPLDILSIIR